MSDRVCIIGAGACGLTGAKTLAEHGIPFDCFEIGTGIGGNWRYGNDNGRSAAYDSLHIDTSKDRMAFSDFPMPEEYPNYLHHSQVLEYFEAYAERFGLEERITFRTRVVRVEPSGPDGGYRVATESLDDGTPRERFYRAVLVANGHHWSPRLPELPGRFDGTMLHSRDYRRPDGLEGQNVLVLGIGNSGVDIACDVAPVAAKTFLSSRRSAHVVPRHLLGRPTDKWTSPLTSRLPLAVQRAFYSLLLLVGRGRQERYGLPRPPTPLLTEHPTLSSHLLPLVAAGEVIPKPAVERFDGSEIVFADGTRERIDTFVCATGYRIRFPFLDREILAAEENRVPLYGRVVHPEQPGLYFIGLIQPLGAIMPLAELQAKWVARLLTGATRLPDTESMWRWIEADRRALAERYVDSPRHTIQVDFFPYRRWLEREMRRPAARPAAPTGDAGQRRSA